MTFVMASLSPSIYCTVPRIATITQWFLGCWREEGEREEEERKGGEREGGREGRREGGRREEGREGGREGREEGITFTWS